MRLNVFVMGDIVGPPGLDVIEERLPSYRREHGIHFVVANAENAERGSGLSGRAYTRLRGAGVDVVTTGDHVWRKKDIFGLLRKERHIIRPANYPDEALGSGWGLFDTDLGVKVGVVNVLGRIFMSPVECPFHAVDRAIEAIRRETPIVIIDVHAEATSEKLALGRHVDGRASLVFGTHTHVPTADAQIFPRGTAYITDVGMTGPYESIIGRKIEPVLHKFITQMPAAFEVAERDARIGGARVAIDAETGKALEIEPVRLKAGE